MEIKVTLNSLEVKKKQTKKLRPLDNSFYFPVERRLLFEPSLKVILSFTFENVEDFLICILKGLNYDGE